MTPWQQAKQIKYLFSIRTWSTGSPDIVFGQIVVTARMKEIARRLGSVLPIVILNVGSADHDPQQPKLIAEQRWTAWLVTSNKFDAIGEGGILGATRSGKHRGSGLLEVQEQLYGVIHSLQSESGLSIYARAATAADGLEDPGLGHVNYRGYVIGTKAVAEVRFYHPASRLVATDLGGGSVKLDWVLPPDRFDRLRVVMERASGSTPPPTVGSGTSVPLGSDLPVTVTDTGLAPGVFSYSLFAQYDETLTKPEATPTTPEQDSAPVSVTVTVT